MIPAQFKTGRKEEIYIKTAASSNFITKPIDGVQQISCTKKQLLNNESRTITRGKQLLCFESQRQRPDFENLPRHKNGLVYRVQREKI